MTDNHANQGRQRPTGRRTGDSGTREAILDAALDLFAKSGYDGASVRAIAARADVDPALIRHFFSDKDTLFATAVADRTTIPQRLAASFEGSPDTLGHRVADTYLRLWEEPETRPILLALTRSSTTSAHAARMLLETLGSQLNAGESAPHDEQLRRLALAGSHLFGIAFARHVVRMPPLVTADRDTLVEQVAPVIQTYLTEADDAA